MTPDRPETVTGFDSIVERCLTNQQDPSLTEKTSTSFRICRIYPLGNPTTRLTNCHLKLGISALSQIHSDPSRHRTSNIIARPLFY